MNTHGARLLSLLFLAGCAETVAGGGGSDRDVPSDVDGAAPDATVDVRTDATVDARTDATVDAFTDAIADAPRDVAPEAGAPCRSSGDCPAGLRCAMPPGCGDGVVGRCDEARGCDMLPVVLRYCDCDGRTFEGAGGCAPDRRYSQSGPCPATDGGTGDAATDGDVPRRYFGAVMAWQSPGGVAGTGPAVLVEAEGATFMWRAVTEFDPFTTVPTADMVNRLPQPVANDLFVRWARVSQTGLPHGTVPFNECYPFVTVRLCATCDATTIRYSDPSQLSPEMAEVWAWFAEHVPGFNPATFCAR